MRREITLKEAASCLAYNPDTGEFKWRKPGRGRRPDLTAGFQDKRSSCGYVFIPINTLLFVAHRFAWLFTHGHMPTGEVDHINGIRDDNRIVNLRDCSKA